MRKLFMLNKPGLKQLAGGVLLGAGAFFIATLISALLTPIMTESVENTQALNEIIYGSSVPVVILVVAVMPAIGEELMFRGFVFGTFRNRYKAAVSVCLTAVLFAAYHLSAIRFFALLPLSFALTYAAYKADSIFVSMLMHLINNGFSVVQARYPDAVGRALPMLAEEDLTGGTAAVLIAGGAVMAAAGLFLLKSPEKNK